MEQIFISTLVRFHNGIKRRDSFANELLSLILNEIELLAPITFEFKCIV